VPRAAAQYLVAVNAISVWHGHGLKHAARNSAQNALLQARIAVASRYDQIETAQEEIRRSNVMERRTNKNLFVTVG
jgi:hypothetical protein